MVWFSVDMVGGQNRQRSGWEQFSVVDVAGTLNRTRKQRLCAKRLDLCRIPMGEDSCSYALEEEAPTPQSMIVCKQGVLTVVTDSSSSIGKQPCRPSHNL